MFPGGRADVSDNGSPGHVRVFGPTVPASYRGSERATSGRFFGSALGCPCGVLAKCPASSIICRVVDSIDPESLKRSVTQLLNSLPAGASLDPSRLTKAALTRLRRDLPVARERLIQLSRHLDPIQQPPFVFDPTNPEIVGGLMGRTMMEQKRRRLDSLSKFYGSGVYAIYYSGNFDAYAPIRGGETPIYVGKADPPTPDCKTVEEQGPKLVGRLSDHAKSIRSASGTLRLEDFDFRFLVVQSGWQRSAEDYLLNEFHPIWTSGACDGFGKHGDAHTKRVHPRSPWDTLHPGRPWATREGNVNNPLSVAQIKEQIAAHFLKYPPRH